MARPAAPRIVLLSAPGALASIDALLANAGVRLVRMVLIRPHAVTPARWLGRVPKFAPPVTVVVTSRRAVEAGVGPWLRNRQARLGAIEFWAAGPNTSHALRALGARRVRRPRILGARGMSSAIGPAPRRVIIYFRSDRAGPQLARELRAMGHRVFDLVVYRLGDNLEMGDRDRRELALANLVIASSPSALSVLRRALSPWSFSRFRRETHLVVLGERSRRAARGHGFRRVLVAPTVTPQPFTRYLLRELRHAST